MYYQALEYIKKLKDRENLAELVQKSNEYFEKLNMGEDYTKPLSEIEEKIEELDLPVKKDEIHDFSLELIYDLFKNRRL